MTPLLPTIRLRWRNGIWAAAFALASCLSAVPANAAEVESVLAAATEAYTDGNYRRAAAQLNELSRQSAQLTPEQKLNLFDLAANIAEVSGLFRQADNAARTHLDLLQRASAAVGGQPSFTERNALVRLARIQRALAGPPPGDAPQPTPNSPLLREAVVLFRTALQDAGTDEPQRPLWEAETRFELARTLEMTGQPQDAASEFTHASSLAEEALDALELSDETAGQFERAIAVIRHAALVSDEAAWRQQATTALQWIKSRLTADNISPALRGKLLAARAACVAQLNDPENEKRVLGEILAAAGTQAEIAPIVRAKAFVRLAELADRAAATQQREPPRRQADTFYAEAADLYEQTRQSAVADARSNDRKKRAASRVTQAECLLQMQLIHTRLADWPQAIRAAEELLALRRNSLLSGSDPNYYRTLASLGALHAKKARSAYLSAAGEGRDLAAARSDGRTAQRYLKPACDFWRGYQPRAAAELATALNHRAEALRYDGEFRQADELLREAEPYCRTAYEPQDVRLGEYYSNRGAVQAALGLFALALDNYDAAVSVANSGDASDLRERRRLLAMVYLNTAQLHKSQRQLAEARTMCEKAHQAARDAGLAPPDLVPFELARASLLIAEAEHNYAFAKQYPGESASAGGINAVQQSLTDAAHITANLLNDQRASNPLQLATARHFNALANYRLFELCGAGESVLQAAEASWKLVAQPPGTRAEPGIDMLRVRALNHLAALALRAAAASRAQAFDISRRDAADQSLIEALTRRAATRLEEADAASRSAEQLASSMVAYPAVRAQALFGRAQVLNAAAQIHRAKARRNQTFIGGDSTGSIDHQRIAQGKTDEAIQTLRAALEIIELPRAMTVGAEAERAEYLAQFAPAFDLLVDLLMHEGRYVEAIQESEKRRSRTFQDQLAASGVDIYATASAQHVRRAQQLRDEYYSTLDALRQNWSDDTRRAALSQNLEQLQREFVAAERAAKSSSRAARQLLVETAAVNRTGPGVPSQTEAWLRDSLGDDDVALVYYLGAERSYVVACGARIGVHGHALTVTAEQAHRRGLWMPQNARDNPTATRPLRAGDVVNLVNDIRAWAERPLRASVNQAIDQERGPGGLKQTIAAKIGPEQLFIATEILLPAALREKLIAARPGHLIIVPDGALHQLPFEMLPTDAERSKYLLDELPPICYAPSLHIHRTLRGNATQATWPVTLVSVADPDYQIAANANPAATARDLSSVAQEFHHYWDGRLAPLESAAEEFAEVTAAFRDLGPERAAILPLTSANATEQNLKDSLREQPVRMLHIAAHGLVSQRHNNLFGALALTTQPHPTAADDGFLALHEVFNLPLQGCDLAVLSACQTNYGPDSPLEAGSTIARAFLCAGARRVVSSHWSVSDKATAPLIGGFMRNVARDLRSGEAVDYATALHAAKLRLRNEPQTAAPYFWAPFVLIGPPTDDRSGG